MKSVKRVEFIIDAHEVDNLLASLAKVNITSYTVLKGAYGNGDHGMRGADIFSDSLSYVLIACGEEEVKVIIEKVRPVLKSLGGICLVSDAMWVMH